MGNRLAENGARSATAPAADPWLAPSGDPWAGQAVPPPPQPPSSAWGSGRQPGTAPWRAADWEWPEARGQAG
eukprot:6188750-Lingulodinium_polyedra.AAC.1